MPKFSLMTLTEMRWEARRVLLCDAPHARTKGRNEMSTRTARRAAITHRLAPDYAGETTTMIAEMKI
jgi:hypothetical protein